MSADHPLRIVEQSWRSDVGRQRSNNEDNYFARAPLFAVADGMGGAQAGEVAAAETVDTFKRGMPDAPPAEALVQLIQEANRRIVEMARARPEFQGMGCTCTAAYFDGDDLVIAHVGDSRAYLLRDGDLIRLTRDHSLVGDLVALGKITEEEAEHHPQRSVITRALGAEATVQVDVEVYPARPGDLFLICSDGLTGMVPDSAIKETLEEVRSLEEATATLVDAANEAGGRDNITVILFRVDAGGPAVVEAGDQETGRFDAAADDGSATSAHVVEGEEARERQRGPVAVAPAPPAPAPARPESRPRPPEAPRGSRRRRRRAIGGTAGVLIALGLVVIGGWIATRAVYFIGTADDGRTIAVFRGLPYELPLGIELYSTEYRSGATIEQVPASRRAAFLEHKLRSLNDAKDLVLRLERGEISR